MERALLSALLAGSDFYQRSPFASCNRFRLVPHQLLWKICRLGPIAVAQVLLVPPVGIKRNVHADGFLQHIRQLPVEILRHLLV